jgi:UPF0755 protein
VKLAASSLILIMLVCGAGWWYVDRWNNAALEFDAASPHMVILRPGESFMVFSRRLAESGVIEHPELWARLAQIRGLARLVKAGEYYVAPGDTPEILLQRLIAGEVVAYAVSLIEGWTAMQAVAELAAHDKLVKELAGVTAETLLGALGLPDGHGEGLFFPDTYRFVAGDSDADILRRAYAMMRTELEAMWQDREPGLPYQTPYEALIVASLIEKETGREADRVHISQVFRARLEQRMRLQTDPSVIYGLGDSFDGNLTRRHLRDDTPYNTYVHRGLPPTPIALPGKQSLHAALHPAAGDFLYFVARGDGSSQFSRTLAEHQAAVRKYQLR